MECFPKLLVDVKEFYREVCSRPNVPCLRLAKVLSMSVVKRGQLLNQSMFPCSGDTLWSEMGSELI